MTPTPTQTIADLARAGRRADAVLAALGLPVAEQHALLDQCTHTLVAHCELPRALADAQSQLALAAQMRSQAQSAAGLCNLVLVQSRQECSAQALQTAESALQTAHAAHQGQVLRVLPAVNLAARLEAYTKKAQRMILIDGATCAALGGQMPVTPLGPVQLKGKAASVEDFAVDA